MAALARNDVGDGELSSQLREEVLCLHLHLLPCQHQPLQTSADVEPLHEPLLHRMLF